MRAKMWGTLVGWNKEPVPATLGVHDDADRIADFETWLKPELASPMWRTRPVNDGRIE